jgi:WD40 repeat protein
VKVWDLPGRRERTLKGHVSDVWGVCFTPDGKALVSGDGDWNRPGDVKVWDMETGKERSALKHTGEVLCVAVSPDGRFLAAGSWDRTLKVWELKKPAP